MRKVLLSTAALFAAMSMNAQVFQVNAESHGLTSDPVDVPEGYVWGEVAGVATISNAFATQHKAVNCKNNDYTSVSFDGNVITTGGGVQGSDNPKDIDGGNPALTLQPAASGAVIQIDAQKDGYAYVVGKLSSNKNYVVFEEGTAVGYTLAMEIVDDRFPNSILTYTVEGEGEYNQVTREIQWAVREALGDVEAATAGNGLGVICFPVYQGCKYYAHATGSKISWCGIYFADAPVSSIVLSKDDGSTLELLSGTDGIREITNSEAKANGAAFNMAGQRVNANAKGIVIANGKKYINK